MLSNEKKKLLEFYKILEYFFFEIGGEDYGSDFEETYNSGTLNFDFIFDCKTLLIQSFVFVLIKRTG
jgi:hypothetical protein